MQTKLQLLSKKLKSISYIYISARHLMHIDPQYSCAPLQHSALPVNLQSDLDYRSIYYINRLSISTFCQLPVSMFRGIEFNRNGITAATRSLSYITLPARESTTKLNTNLFCSSRRICSTMHRKFEYICVLYESITRKCNILTRNS